MFITEVEVAIILVLSIKQSKPTPAGYPGILAGVHVKITIERDNYGLEGVG
ncbi:MAG: hypothetical protein WBM44_19970 [Waterburya sp.]